MDFKVHVFRLYESKSVPFGTFVTIGTHRDPCYGVPYNKNV